MMNGSMTTISYIPLSEDESFDALICYLTRNYLDFITVFDEIRNFSWFGVTNKIKHSGK